MKLAGHASKQRNDDFISIEHYDNNMYRDAYNTVSYLADWPCVETKLKYIMKLSYFRHAAAWIFSNWDSWPSFWNQARPSICRYNTRQPSWLTRAILTPKITLTHVILIFLNAFFVTYGHLLLFYLSTAKSSLENSLFLFVVILVHRNYQNCELLSSQ